MKYKIFVDGQHGTTGLKIHEMLEGREEIELLSIKEEEKKDLNKRKELLNSADLVFLCLPDAASIESVSLITNENVKVIDASTAFRTNPSWTYGIPEITATQREKIKNSKTSLCSRMSCKWINNSYETFDCKWDISKFSKINLPLNYRI
ncbi:hypothetical protein ACN2C3_05650 [Aliarcobacter butzleri]